jgi:hypothetical protein
LPSTDQYAFPIRDILEAIQSKSLIHAFHVIIPYLRHFQIVHSIVGGFSITCVRIGRSRGTMQTFAKGVNEAPNPLNVSIYSNNE